MQLPGLKKRVLTMHFWKDYGSVLRLNMLSEDGVTWSIKCIFKYKPKFKLFVQWLFCFINCIIVKLDGLYYAFFGACFTFLLWSVCEFIADKEFWLLLMCLLILLLYSTPLLIGDKLSVPYVTKYSDYLCCNMGFDIVYR